MSWMNWSVGAKEQQGHFHVYLYEVSKVTSRPLSQLHSLTAAVNN